ncbi:MAG: diheme cytochrome c [Mariprofundaceae bacterium]|nr:diheme cytochrome c [Mariprofundaceae bacterium]
MATLAWSDGSEWGENNEHEGKGFIQQTAGVSSVNNKAYKNECSSCHFAYPAGFLPKRSWIKIMTTLDDHFGEDAELDAQDAQGIETYLLNNAADQRPNRFSRSIMRSIDSRTTPLRITKTPYFRHRHREIPTRMVEGNAKVRSFSNCLACHSGASQGSFDEDSVRIPGYRFWED